MIESTPDCISMVTWHPGRVRILVNEFHVLHELFSVGEEPVALRTVGRVGAPDQRGVLKEGEPSRHHPHHHQGVGEATGGHHRMGFARAG